MYKSISQLDCETNRSNPDEKFWESQSSRLGSGSKDGFSDLGDPFGLGTYLLDKSYSGDNRLVLSDSSH
jgi:hypothetical protein